MKLSDKIEKIYAMTTIYSFIDKFIAILHSRETYETRIQRSHRV